MFHTKPFFRWVHDVMKEMKTDICLIRLPGGATIVPVLDPAIAREMLRKHDVSFADRPTSLGSHVISGGYRLRDNSAGPTQRPVAQNAEGDDLRDRLPGPAQVAPRQARRGGRQPRLLRPQPLHGREERRPQGRHAALLRQRHEEDALWPQVYYVINKLVPITHTIYLLLIIIIRTNMLPTRN
ncbi:unnamed protein product [Linum tenue]|uniref:Uncharacterized protein n=1 Tax=Linum tenue TaxID=586396 RepID=A0AAV0GWH3_9ROSI|nr:unnamed protein product [Linum tenue]